MIEDKCGFFTSQSPTIYNPNLQLDVSVELDARSFFLYGLYDLLVPTEPGPVDSPFTYRNLAYCSLSSSETVANDLFNLLHGCDNLVEEQDFIDLYFRQIEEGRKTFKKLHPEQFENFLEETRRIFDSLRDGTRKPVKYYLKHVQASGHPKPVREVLSWGEVEKMLDQD